MRRLRWKKSYATHNPVVDERSRTLIGILNDMGDQLRAKEHCQDMNELHDDLQHLATDMLTAQKAANADLESASEASRHRFSEVRKERLPLPARDTPACRDCSLCDQLQDELGRWTT